MTTSQAHLSPLALHSAGRAVFVTSCFADGGLPGVGLLSATSAALDALADCLRLETQGRVKVSTVRLGDFSLTTGLLSEHHRSAGEVIWESYKTAAAAPVHA